MQKLALVLSIGLMLVIPASGAGIKVEIKYDAFLNRITGQVWGPNRQPVPNIYIELNNEVNSTIDRQRTSNAGLYEFSNLSAGLFRVHVLTLGTDYLDQTKEVQILNLVAGMSDNQYCDFELKYDPRRVSSAAGSGGRAEEVFAQQGVTAEAEKFYNKGRDLLMEKKSEAAMAAFKQALALFPNYYYANNALGKELVERGKYQESFPYLIKAIDANQRSFDSYYALAYGTFELKQMAEAKAAAQAAVVLRPNSLNAQLLLGTILRQSGDLPGAEKALVKAKTIGQNRVAAVNWQLALAYNRMNRNKDAIAELETYIKNEPNGANKNAANDLIAKLKTAKSQ